MAAISTPAANGPQCSEYFWSMNCQRPTGNVNFCWVSRITLAMTNSLRVEMNEISRAVLAPDGRLHGALPNESCWSGLRCDHGFPLPFRYYELTL